jgi:hypothetical protein
MELPCGVSSRHLVNSASSEASTVVHPASEAYSAMWRYLRTDWDVKSTKIDKWADWEGVETRPNSNRSRQSDGCDTPTFRWCVQGTTRTMDNNCVGHDPNGVFSSCYVHPPYLILQVSDAEVDVQYRSALSARSGRNSCSGVDCDMELVLQSRRNALVATSQFSQSAQCAAHSTAFLAQRLQQWCKTRASSDLRTPQSQPQTSKDFTFSPSRSCEASQCWACALSCSCNLTHQCGARRPVRQALATRFCQTPRSSIVELYAFPKLCSCRVNRQCSRPTFKPRASYTRLTRRVRDRQLSSQNTTLDMQHTGQHLTRRRRRLQ